MTNITAPAALPKINKTDNMRKLALELAKANQTLIESSEKQICASTDYIAAMAPGKPWEERLEAMEPALAAKRSAITITGDSVASFRKLETYLRTEALKENPRLVGKGEALLVNILNQFIAEVAAEKGLPPLAENDSYLLSSPSPRR
jgi:hypothetical protein